MQTHDAETRKSLRDAITKYEFGANNFFNLPNHTVRVDNLVITSFGIQPYYYCVAKVTIDRNGTLESFDDLQYVMNERFEVLGDTTRKNMADLKCGFIPKKWR